MDHTYDALGQRIARVVVGVETDHYGLDNGNVWVVMDGNNNLGSRRLFGPAVDMVVARVWSTGTVA